MKLRTKLLASNRKQTKIQALLSLPTPAPTHTPTTNEKHSCSPVCCVLLRAGPDPRLCGQPLLSSGTQRQGCFPLQQDSAWLVKGWGWDFQNLLEAPVLTPHQPSSQCRSPLDKGSLSKSSPYSVVGCKLSFSSRFSVPLSSSSISPSSPLNLSWAHLGLVLDFRNMNRPRPRGKAPRPRPRLTHLSLPSPSRSSCK